jgi:hypothetical protein
MKVCTAINIKAFLLYIYIIPPPVGTTRYPNQYHTSYEKHVGWDDLELPLTATLSIGSTGCHNKDQALYEKYSGWDDPELPLTDTSSIGSTGCPHKNQTLYEKYCGLG